MLRLKSVYCLVKNYQIKEIHKIKTIKPHIIMLI